MYRFIVPSVPVSWGCHHTAAQSGLNIADVYSSMVLEPGSLKSRCLQVCALMGAFLAPPSFWLGPATLGIPELVATFLQPQPLWPHGFSLCVPSLCLFSSYKDTGQMVSPYSILCDYRPHYDLSLTNAICNDPLSIKGTFYGAGG